MAKKLEDKKSKDNLVESLAESINKASEKEYGYEILKFLDDDTEYYSKLKNWISTGVDTLDIIVSNRAHAGLPTGRIVEINGLESSGKSLLCAHILAETQKKDGLAVFIDTENAVSEDFMRAIGIQLEGDNKLIYTQLETIEQIFQLITKIIETVRKSTKHKNKPVTIVVDSLAGATTEAELAGGLEKQGYNTSKALLLSSFMRQLTNLFGQEQILIVFTNQLRERLNVTFGEKYASSGGKAVPYHASVRIRVSAIKKIIKEDKETKVKKVIGLEIEAKIIKSRLGAPHKTTVFKMYFDSGIDNAESFLGELKRYKIVDGKLKYKFVDLDGKEYEFNLKELRQMFTEPENELREKMYMMLVSKMTEKYNFQKMGEIEQEEEIELQDGSDLND